MDKKENNIEEKEKEANESVENNNKDNKDKENEQDDMSSSHESIFNEDLSEKEEEKESNKNIGLNNIFLENKKKRELTEEQKEERIKRNIEKYCKRNDRMLVLLEKINNKETTRKNINEMMRLLAIDLSDTKKLTNRKALISQRKKELFNKLFDLTFKEYQFFWFQLTEGKYRKGNAQLINSGNIRKAKLIYAKIIENREKEKNDGNKPIEMTVREIIKDKNNKDIEKEKLDEIFFGNDSEISSDEDSLDSSIDESSFDDESNKKLEMEKKEKELKEKELKEKMRKEKEKKEKEEKEREEKQKEKDEKIKKYLEEEDEIDIFN